MDSTRNLEEETANASPPIIHDDLVECLGEILGRKLQVERRPLPENDPVHRRPDTTRARQRINWKPRVELLDGLRQTVEYFRGVVPTV